jgi:AcrR family transcriptional regulator
MAARAVPTTDEEHHGYDQHDHDDDYDPEHFHPAWCAGIGRPVSHVRLLSSCVVVEAYFMTAIVYRGRMSSSNRNVSTIVIMYTEVVPKLWNETIEAHRRAVRDAILETTWALVAEHGLTSVTMSRIAEKTGIGRATLYGYFPDVEAILVAWHQRHVTGHLEHLAELRDQAGDAGERLEAVLEAYALISRESHRHHDTELAAFLHRDEQVARAQQQLRNMIRDLLTEGEKTGDLRDDVPPDELAGYCLHALTAASSLPSEVAVRRLVTVTLAGLRRTR